MIQLFINIIKTTLVFSLIIVVLFIVMHLIGEKFTARCRYILWALIFIRLAIPFGPFSGVALFTLELPITESSITQNIIFPSSNNSNPNTINTLDNSYKVNAQQNQQVIVNSDVANRINLFDYTSLSTLTNPSQSIGFLEIYGAFILSILALIWVAVAIVYILWHITIYLLYAAKVKKSLIPADEAAHDILSQLCAQEKIMRIPKLYISTTIGSPMLFGFFHSTIAIPENLLGNHSLTSIITHELIHYKRKDLWLKLIAMFAISIHWFNPLIHIAARTFDSEMELSCDELVLKNYNSEERASYGNAMLDIVKRCHSKNTVLTTLILVMILVCVLAGTLIACATTKPAESSVDSTTNTETETLSTVVSAPIQIETEEAGSFIPTGNAGVIYIIKGNDNNLFSSSDKTRDAILYVGTYPCTTSDASFKCGYGSKILVYDGGYFIYDYITGKSKEIILPDIVPGNYSFVYDTNSQKILGLRIKEDVTNRAAFYNFKLQRFITTFSYSYMKQESACNYLFVTSPYMDSILDIDTGKVLFAAKNDGFSKMSYLSNKNGIYFIINDQYGDKFDIYNGDFKPILSNNPTLYNQDITTGAELIKLVEWSDHMLFSSCRLIDDEIYGFPLGLYISIFDYSVTKETLGYFNEYYYHPNTGENGVKKYDDPAIGGYEKPVLYLYPIVKTDITVKFASPNLLTTTYPKYKDSWNVTANPDGSLYEANGRYYYGLYWEESSFKRIDFRTGFYVNAENAAEFLEEKLDILGFTQREANEFIMYWLPILEKNGQNLVYFELTESREAYNSLNIMPAPDSLLRVAIHVKQVDSPVNIEEQYLPTFQRKGFAAIEWGGVSYN